MHIMLHFGSGVCHVIITGVLFSYFQCTCDCMGFVNDVVLLSRMVD